MARLKRKSRKRGFWWELGRQSDEFKNFSRSMSEEMGMKRIQVGGDSGILYLGQKTDVSLVSHQTSGLCDG